MKHHKHSTKGWETPVHEPQEERQRDDGVKSVALLPSKKTPLFTLQTLSCLSLHSLTTTLSPLISVVIACAEKPPQV